MVLAFASMPDQSFVEEQHTFAEARTLDAIPLFLSPPPSLCFFNRHTGTEWLSNLQPFQNCRRSWDALQYSNTHVPAKLCKTQAGCILSHRPDTCWEAARLSVVAAVHAQYLASQQVPAVVLMLVLQLLLLLLLLQNFLLSSKGWCMPSSVAADVHNGRLVGLPLGRLSRSHAFNSSLLLTVAAQHSSIAGAFHEGALAGSSLGQAV